MLYGHNPLTPVLGQCLLSRTGATELTLSRRNGKHLFINGANVEIPSAGVTAGTGGLSTSTLYYVYAYVSAGTLTLELSATARATDSTYGHQIKNGDATRTLVGLVRTNGSTEFVDTAAQRFVRSWFNEPGVAIKGVLTADRSVTSAALTYAEIHSEMRVEALVWDGETFDVTLSGGASNDNAGAASFTAIGFNGTTAESPGQLTVNTAANTYLGCSIRSAKTGLTEGYNYATGLSCSDIGANKYRGTNTPVGLTGRVGR